MRKHQVAARHKSGGQICFGPISIAISIRQRAAAYSFERIEAAANGQ